MTESPTGSEGHRERLRSLFEEHYAELCSQARRYVGSDEAAVDVVQEIFARVWERRSERPPDEIERAYLYRAVRNEALNRRERRRSRDEHRQRPGVPRPASPTPEDDLERRRLVREVEEAIEALPPRCREIFLLVRRDGLTYREAAEALELSPSTVDTQMGRALKRLRDELDDWLD